MHRADGRRCSVLLLPPIHGGVRRRVDLCRRRVRPCEKRMKTEDYLDEMLERKEQLELAEQATAIRKFTSGSVRDTDDGKYDYEGFLSPVVLAAFAEYMHGHRKLADGTYRASDNWQAGIPLDA